MHRMTVKNISRKSYEKNEDRKSCHGNLKSSCIILHIVLYYLK